MGTGRSSPNCRVAFQPLGLDFLALLASLDMNNGTILPMVLTELS